MTKWVREWDTEAGIPGIKNYWGWGRKPCPPPYYYEKMRRQSLDIYDDMPRAMRRYVSNYGFHFNKNAFEYAVSLMMKRDTSGKQSPIKAATKEEVETKLKKLGITIDNNTLYDAAFVWNMGLADYLGSSIVDETHLAFYVKDTLDDVDAAPDTTFRRWMATMVGAGIPIDWEDFL